MNVFDQFDEPAKPPQQPPRKNVFDQFDEATAPPPPPDMRQQFLESVPGQVGQGALEGLASLPGLPIDAIVAGGNFVRRQFDQPEARLEDSPLAGWGGQGWRDALLPGFDEQQVSPQGPVGAFARKAGQFAGGALPFGIAGAVPALTAAIGSEAGKKLDEVAPELTKGYGEFVGAVGGGFAPGVKAMLSRPRVTTKAPTVDQLHAQASAAYDAADNAGVVIAPQAIQRLYNTIGPDVANFGYDANLHPQIGTVLKRIEDSGQGNATLKHLDILRRVARNAGQSPLNPSQGALSGKIVGHIDDFIDNLQPADVVSGDATAAAAALKEARSLWTRMTKAEKIEAALENADTQAGSTYSGGNIDNATRQKLRPMVTRGNKQSRGWTADEKALIKRVVKGGGYGQQFARGLGKMSPESGFGKYLLAGFGAGSLVSPAMTPMLGLSAAGFVSKRIADAMTRGNVNDLLDAVRRGQAYQPRQPTRMLTRSGAALPGAIQQR